MQSELTRQNICDLNRSIFALIQNQLWITVNSSNYNSKQRKREKKIVVPDLKKSKNIINIKEIRVIEHVLEIAEMNIRVVLCMLESAHINIF